MVRMGPRMGPTAGPLLGPNPSFSAPAPASIYSQTDAAGVSAYIQGLLASTDDYTAAGGYTFDTDGTDFVGGKTLVDRSGATVSASPHGKSAGEAASGAAWTIGDTSSFNITFGAGQGIALLMRLKVSAAPASNAVFVGKGNGTIYYAGAIDTSGQLMVDARKAGAPSGTTATVTGSIADGSWRWAVVGITRTSAKVYAAIAGSAVAETGFLASNSVSNAAAFGLSALDSTTGGVDCAVDQLLIFTGTPAENVYTNAAALLAALEAAE